MGGGTQKQRQCAYAGMPQIKYASRAYGDIGRLYKFLAEKDTLAALNAVTTIHDAIVILGHAPGMGRPVEDGPRELVIDFGSGGHLSLYEFDEILDEVLVLAVKPKACR